MADAGGARASSRGARGARFRARWGRSARGLPWVGSKRGAVPTHSVGKNPAFGPTAVVPSLCPACGQPRAPKPFGARGASYKAPRRETTPRAIRDARGVVWQVVNCLAHGNPTAPSLDHAPRLRRAEGPRAAHDVRRATGSGAQ